MLKSIKNKIILNFKFINSFLYYNFLYFKGKSDEKYNRSLYCISYCANGRF